MAKSCSAVRVTRSRAAITTVPRQPRHSSAIHTAPRCAASRPVTTAGLTISATEWLNTEVEFARPRILSSAILLNIVLPYPSHIKDHCALKLQQREQEDHEMMTREAVGKEQHLEGP